MDAIQYNALLIHFTNRRLCPWLPEHELFIRGEIAKLEVVDPSAAKGFKEYYQKSMDEYIKAHPEEFPVVVPARSKSKKEETKEEAVEEVKEEPKKKPGRKPKAS